MHRERLDPTEVTVRHGVPATVPARAAFDAARRADDLRAAVQVLDLALAAGVIGRERFRAWIEAKSGWPGLRQVRSALALAEERCASPQETALRMIWLLDARLPRPRCNWPVADANGQFIGRPDLLSTDFGVIGEFDGATHRTRSQHREDLRRDDRFRAVGLETFRVVGADLGDIELVVRRIRDAIDRSARLPKSYLIRA